jgi:ribokinase
MKLGNGGCVLVSERECTLQQPPPHLEVVDKTGAGDAFAGGLATALFWKKSASQALRYAVAASSNAVTAYGSQASYPDLAQLERLLASMP